MTRIAARDHVGPRGRARLVARLLGIAAFALVGNAFATTYYTYDILGRVSQVTESDGSTSTYAYDANGNVTSITRVAGTSALSVGSISAPSGASGSQITILGTGFSSTASQDTVSFNGVDGIVTYASGNRLVVTVPAGATTGDISVTTPGGTVKTSTAFTVLPVAVTGFSPSLAAPGATVTVTGGGFSATASQDTVLVNGVAATVVTASATQLTITVPAAATSGHITVKTSTGSASSSGFLVVPSEGYTASNLGAVGEPAINEDGLVMTIDKGNQVALALFDGTQGELMNLLLTEVSMSGTYSIYSPSGTSIATGTISNNMILGLPALPATGTYSLYLVPSSGIGSATVGILAHAVGTVATTGAPIAVSLLQGQSAAYKFTATAGQSYSLALTTMTSVPAGGYLTATIVNSAGTTVANCGSYYSSATPAGNCDFATTAGGTYTILLVPSGIATTTFNLLVNADVTTSLSAGSPGATVNVNLPTAGQHGLLHFTATAGETLALYVGLVSTSASYVSVFVTGPTGTAIASNNVSTAGPSLTFNLTNLAAGTYSVLIIPYNNATASLQAILANGVTGTVPTTGVSATFKTSVPGQYAYLTFAGTAGQSLGLGITQVTLTPATTNNVSLNVTAPGGASISSGTCYSSASPGCQLSFRNLAQTGSYSLVVAPGGQSTLNATFTLSVDTSGALSLTTPTTLNLATAGADASLTFTATAGESLAIDLSTITTVPPSSSMIVYVYNSSGTLVSSTSTTSGASLSLPNLPAGNYTALIVPNNAATGSVTVTSTADVTGTLVVGTPYSVNVPTLGQDAWLSFTATAGENLVLDVTGVVTTPANSATAITIYNSSGGIVTSGTASTTANGSIALSNLTAGTYYVLVHPNTTSASMTLTLLNGIYASFSPTGGSLTISAAVGQNAYLSVPGTVGENLTFALSNVVSADGGVYINIYQPNGNFVQGATCSVSTPVCSFSLENLPATGTYSVVATTTPWGQSAMSFTATAAQDVTANLVAGTPYSLSLPKVGQDGLLTFTATAGQTLALELGSVVTSPTGTNVTVAISGPGIGGPAVASENVTSTNAPTLNLTNLAAGTYTVLVHPSTTSASLSLTLLNNPGVVVPTTGSGMNVSAAVGENAYLSFSGTAGQNVTFALSNVVSADGGVYINIYQPNGNFVEGATCSVSTPVCSFSLQNLPATGTYSVVATTTPWGQSAMSFTAIVAQDVTGTLVAGTPYSLSLPKTGQDGVVTFTATAGQTVALEVGSVVTSPSGNNVSVSISGPGTGGPAVASETVTSTNAPTFNLTNLAAGTYTVLVHPSTTSASLSLTLINNPGVVVPTTGSGVNVSAAVGENAYLTFSGTAGQNVTFALSNTTSSDGGVYINIYAPNGNFLQGATCSVNTPVCSFSLQNLPATGTYSVVATTTPWGQSAMSFTAIVAQDVTGTLVAGTPYSLSLPKTGQDGVVTFTATAGQTVALEVGSVVTSPSGNNVSVSISGPGTGGPAVASETVTSTNAPTFNLTNLAAGTYTVLVHPSTTSASLSLTLINNPGVVVPTTGSGVNVSAAVGENAYLTFSGTAGQNVTFALSNTTSSDGGVYINIYAPNGNFLQGATCSVNTPVCSFSLQNLPATGTYSVVATTTPWGQSAMSFTAIVAQDVTGTLVAGTPYSLSLPKTGQDGVVTFTATAGQTVALEVGSVVTSPSGNNVSVSISGPGTGGPAVASETVTSTNAPTFNLTNLAAGTYTVLVHPSTTSASLSLTLLNNPGVVVPTTGSGVNVSAAVGENAYLSFSGTAGQNLTFALSNVVSADGGVYINIYQPNGNFVQGATCSVSTPVCSFSLENLPATGTYSVVATTTPWGQSAMSFTAIVAQDVTGTLVAGTPYSLSLPKTGQDGLLTFALSATSSVNLQVNGVVTSPANETVAVTIYNAAGSAVGSGSTATSTTIAMSSLAPGTYSVLVHPAALTATMSIQY